MLQLRSRVALINAVDLCFPGISQRCSSKFINVVSSDPTTIGINFAFVFHCFCISSMRSSYLKIFSYSLSLIFLSRGTAMSIIVVVRFALSTTTISGLRAGITLSVRISKSRNTFTFLFSVTGSG